MLRGRYGEDEWGFLGGNRERRGVTQAEMADAVGISLRHYKRLEQGLIDDPGIRLMHNCALALGLSLYEVIPARLHAWTDFRGDRPWPPEWETFFDHTDARFSWDISVASVVDQADIDYEWFDERLAGLERKADENDLPPPVPLHRLPPAWAFDPRLEPVEDVLREALVAAGEGRVGGEDLLLALAEIEGPVSQLLDELGVREAIIDRLSEGRD